MNQVTFVHSEQLCGEQNEEEEEKERQQQKTNCTRIPKVQTQPINQSLCQCD